MSLHVVHTLSNEAMYQKTWSSFVDGAISKHQRQERGGCAEGEGGIGAGRFELRDVMCLEEVLAKLENAQGGWIDYESRPPNIELHDGDTMESETKFLGPARDNPLGGKNRQPSQNTPGLPPMFENPRPSFFASMYGSPGLFQAAGKGSRPPSPSLDSRRADPSIALDPERHFSGIPGTKEGQRLTPRGRSPDGGGTGADMSAFIPASETEDTEEQAVDGPDTTGFDEGRGVVCKEGRSSNSNSRSVPVSGDEDCGGCPASSFSARSEVDMACPISPESLLHPAGPTVPPTAVECDLLEPCQRGGAMQHLTTPWENDKETHKGESRHRAPSIGDRGIVQAAVAVEASEDHQLDVAAAAEEQEQARICQNQEGNEKEESDRSLGQEEERQGAQRVGYFPGTPPQQPGSFREDVMLSQLSERLDATRIDEAEVGDSGSLATGLHELLPQDFPRPRQLDFERKVEAAAAGNSSSSSSSSSSGGGGGGQAHSDCDLASLHDSIAHDHDHDHNNNISFRSGQNSSSAAALRIPGSGSTANTADPMMQAGGSADPGISRGSSGSHLGPVSPEGLRREPRGDEDDHASANSKAESPEMLRLGSASSRDADGARHRDRDLSFDRGSWGEVAAVTGGRLAGGYVHCDMERNGGAMFSVVQSPDGAPSARERDSQAFGSTLSPAIGDFGAMDGVGGDVIGSLSPLALARSLDESDEACGGGDDGGCRDPFSGEDGGDYGGLSPVMSARSESTVDSDGGPSPSPKPKKTYFAEEAEGPEKGDGDNDITLTPEVSRSSAVTSSQPRFTVYSGGESWGQGKGRGSEWGNVGGVEGDGSGLMLPPPPRQPSLSPRRKQQQQQRRRRRQPENPEARWLLPHTGRGRSAFADRTNTPAGRCDERSRDADHASPKHGGGGGGGVGSGCDELIGNVSIGSFSESEATESRFGTSPAGSGGGRDMDKAHDSSLVECTPRRLRASPRQDLGGFYPPLQVSNIAKQEPQDLGLSNLQRSTLQWMLWREGCEEEEGEGRGGGTSMVSSISDDTAVKVNVKGGVLGHLSSEEASKCVHALLRRKAAADGAAGGKGDSKRARPAHAVTGLPCGAALIIAPTKEAAWRWSHRLESGVDGLSVLSYVMPLRERRRLSAKQAAAFDVVVTTYDVLKAKEVPRGVEATKATSPRSWALPGSKQWRTRNVKEEEGKRKPAAASKTDHMVSLLHGVWWDRVVADGAQILVNQRSARAAAALALVGTARWCVVERESMPVVENTSERMRCLTAFLRIPAEVAMVQAAEKLFYHSRPGHVAPLHPRGPGAADNSLSLSQVDADGQSTPGSSHGANIDGRRSEPAVEKAAGLSALQESGGGAGAREGRGSRRKSSSRVRAGVPENERHGGDGVGGRAAAGVALSRGDVEYTATTLRLRRARG